MTSINVTACENWKFRLRHYDSTDINPKVRCQSKIQIIYKNNWLEVSNAHNERIVNESHGNRQHLWGIFFFKWAVLQSKSHYPSQRQGVSILLSPDTVRRASLKAKKELWGAIWRTLLVCCLKKALTFFRKMQWFSEVACLRKRREFAYKIWSFPLGEVQQALCWASEGKRGRRGLAGF